MTDDPSWDDHTDELPKPPSDLPVDLADEPSANPLIHCAGWPDPKTDWIEKLFAHHAPTVDQAERMQQLLTAGKHFAMLILKLTPSSPYQLRAIDQVLHATHTAHLAITHGPATP